MAIDLGQDEMGRSGVERTWRIEIFSDLDTVPVIRVHREQIWSYKGQVDKRMAVGAIEITAETAAGLTYGGVTGVELNDILVAWGDGLSRYKPEPAPVPEEGESSEDNG